jgi:hypothetical protein
MKILFLLFFIAMLVFIGRDIYWVWFHPNKFIEKTISRRDKIYPSMKGQPLLFDNNTLIKMDRIALPFVFILIFLIFLLVLMEI